MRTVLGIDAGGTATRAVLCAMDGAVLARGAAGPGNPVARGAEAASAAMRQAVGAALRGTDPGRVVAVLAGIAGSSALDDPAVAARYAQRLRATGLRCALRSVGDAVTAFAAGSPERAGTVLVAGTGAVAARIVDGEVTAVADGLGWLLGDEGSGFWLGRAAVRSTVRQLRAGQPCGVLARSVLATMLDGAAGPATPAAPADLIMAAHRAGPGLSALAPLVIAADASGDPAAAAIVAGAGDLLYATLTGVDPGDLPIVLAGGVLTAGSPVAERLQRRLAAALGRTAAVAGEPAVAAAWLALVSATGADRAAAAGLHARMLPVDGP